MCTMGNNSYFVLTTVSCDGSYHPLVIFPVHEFLIQTRSKRDVAKEGQPPSLCFRNWFLFLSIYIQKFFTNIFLSFNQILKIHANILHLYLELKNIEGK